jgi:PAS domain S-box-containing protein
MGANHATTNDIDALEPPSGLQTIFDHAAIGLVQGTVEGRILLINNRLCEMLGYTSEELLANPSAMLGHPDDRERTRQMLERVARGEVESFTLDKRYVRKDGTSLWTSVSVSSIRKGGQMDTIVAIVQDISERKAAEEAYRRSVERLRQVYELSAAVAQASDAVSVYDLALKGLRDTLSVNRAAVLLADADGVMRFKAWFGIDDAYRAMAEGHSPWPADATDPLPVLVPDVAEDPHLSPLKDHIMGHGIRALGFIPLVYEARLLGKLMVYFDDPHEFQPEEVQVAQTVANHVAFAIARKAAEEKLRLYQKIVQNSVDGIAIISPDGHYVEQNQAHEELLGYGMTDLQEATPAIHLGDEAYAHVAQNLSARGVFRGETRSRRKDGREIDVEIAAFEVLDGQGDVQCYVGIKREISQRKDAERKLRESEVRFRTMANSAPIMLWVADESGSCTWLNNRWLEFTGRDMEQDLGVGWLENVHPEDRQQVEGIYRQALAERAPFAAEYRLLRQDGEYRWVFDHGAPRITPDGTFEGHIGSCTDITERREAHDNMERLNATLEQHVRERTAELTAANDELQGFTYSVSHDLRAPLRGIMASSRILLEECSEKLTDDQRRLLERQAQNAKKLGDLIDDLLKLSRIGRQEMVRSQVDVSAMAEEIAADLRSREWPCEIAFDIRAGLQAMADQKLLKFVLLNLLENACKFSPQGGTVEVGQENGAFYVRDSGIGFDMQYAGKLFLPFERLVRDSDFPGTGIGLANVKRIVERHGGMVWAESQPGSGSVFWFTLG